MAEKRIVPGEKGTYKSLDEALNEVDKAMQGKEFYGGTVYFKDGEIDGGVGIGSFILLAYIPTGGCEIARIEVATLKAKAEKDEAEKSMPFGPLDDRISILKCNGLIFQNGDYLYFEAKAFRAKYACQFNVEVDSRHA